jgi:hypothetical protein
LESFVDFVEGGASQDGYQTAEKAGCQENEGEEGEEECVEGQAAANLFARRRFFK